MFDYARVPYMGYPQVTDGFQHARSYVVELSASVFGNVAVRDSIGIRVSEQTRKHLIYHRFGYRRNNGFLFGGFFRHGILDCRKVRDTPGPQDRRRKDPDFRTRRRAIP